MREGEKMALFNAQFFTELINYINSTKNVRRGEPCICVVPTTLGDLRMFKTVFPKTVTQAWRRIRIT